MKNYIIRFFVIIALISISFTEAYSQQQKLAQTGFKFLYVSNDARVSSMAETGTSLRFGYASSMFYNPAGMANLNKLVDVSFGQTQWIADINYMSGSLAFAPFDNNFGVFGISVVAVDYGSFYQTVRSTGERGFEEIGTYSPTALSVGIGYAKMLSEKFSIGANVKYATQTLGTGVTAIAADGNYVEEDFKTNTVAFDFGVIYKTGFKSLNVGMSIRNFSKEIKYVDENFELPLTFRVGMSMDMMDIIQPDQDMHTFNLAVDATNPRDNKEYVNIGGEYIFMNTLALRGGYSGFDNNGGLTAGAGVMQEVAGFLLAVDYAYAPFDIFDAVHRFTVRFSF